MNEFQSFLDTHLVLFDGAMGTYIYEKGIFIDKCYDELNISNPDLILNIHQEYIKAGADVIETNTFGANRYKLRRYGLSEKTREINYQGAILAKRAVQDQFIAGSIGPLGIKLEPFGEVTEEAARSAFSECASSLLEGGIDLFILETFHDIHELDLALQTIRDLSDLPIIGQMTVHGDGKSSYGLDLDDIVHFFNSSHVNAFGLNCSIGPKTMLDFVERMIERTSLPISIMPNAGLPQFVDGRQLYMSTPDYFAVYTKRFIESGVQIIGGCCGTTPEHIRKMAGTLAQKQTRLKDKVKVPKDIELSQALPEPVPRDQKSNLSNKICNDQFVTLVEMVPPRGKSLQKALDGARMLKQADIDAINIPDGPRASARMNPMALGVRIQNEADIEVVLHYTCRDRNLLGMQSDLLGAAVLDIKNILIITGDPPMMGDCPQATAVFDIDSIGLTRLVHQMNHGLDIGNKPMRETTGFFIGVGVDPNSINMEWELSRFHQKIEAGAEFVITQPVFDLDALKRFLERIQQIQVSVIAGVWPLMSLRNAEFMHNEVPGVSVPDIVLKKMSKFENKEDQQKVGIDIARKMAADIRSLVAGIQISAPFGRYDIPLKIIDK